MPIIKIIETQKAIHYQNKRQSRLFIEHLKRNHTMKKNQKTTNNKKSKKVYYMPTEPVHTVSAKSSIGISVKKIKEMKKSGDTYYIV